MRDVWGPIVARRRDQIGAEGDERSRFNEIGDTLIEVLLSLIVLSLASVALVIAFSVTISATADHRRMATADIVLGSTSEQAVSAVSSDLNLFQTCQPLSTYQNTATIPLSIPSIYSNTYQVKITGVQYWNGNRFTTCVVGAPQEITITVTDATGHQYVNTFVVNYPLASGNQNTYAGSADHLVFLSQPPSTNASGVPFSTQPVVEIVDNSGLVVTTDLSPVTLAISSGTAGAVLSGCSGNELSGVVTFTGCAINTAGRYVIQASDASLPPISASVSTSSFAVSGTAPYVKFTYQPIAGASGSAFTTQPAISVYSGTSVDTAWSGTVTISASGGVLSSNCSTVAITNGVGAALNCIFMGGYLYDPISNVTLAIPYTMTATASGLIPATSNAFQVTGPGPASQLVFSQQPTGIASLSASAAFTTQPIVTIEDAFGNVATTSSNPITLTMNGGTLQNCTSTSSKGVVTFSGCGGTAYGSGFTLTATSAGLTSVTSSSFDITGLAASLKFTTQPVAGVSGGPMPTLPVVTIYDASGLVVTASTTPVSLTTSGGSLQFCTGLTPVNGVVSVGTCTFAGLVGTPYTMTATQGSLSVVSKSFSPTDPGPATQLVYTTAPVAGAAGSLLTTQPVVKVEDSAGNVVITSSAPIAVTTAAGTLASCNSLLAVSGVVNVAGCTFGGVVGSPYTIVASSPGLTSATAVISPTSPGPANALLASSGSGQSTTVMSAFASPLVATLTDFWGNNISGVSVTFTAPVSGSPASATATFAGGVISATTGATGHATSAGLTANQVAGPYAITASAGGLSTTFTETNTAKRTNDAMTIISGNSQTAAVGTIFGIGLEVRILDEYGNPVPNMNVAYAGPTSGASATFAPCASNPNANSCTVVTDVNGLAPASTLTANHLVGTYPVSASATGVANPSTFSLTNQVGAVAEVLLSSSPSTNIAKATTNITLGLQLADQYGNPTTSASNQVINLTSSSGRGFFNATLGGSGTLGASTNVTITAGGTGSASVTYGDENAATPTITATNGSVNWGSIGLTINPGPAATLQATAGANQTGRAGLNFANPVVATVTDAFNNLVAGTVVTFSAPTSGQSATFASSATTTGTGTSGLIGQASSGTFTANGKLGTYLITASVTGVTPVTFSETNQAGMPATIKVISGSGQSATVGAGFTNPLVAQVLDSYGNPVPSVAVGFTQNGGAGGANFTGGVTTATTDVNGNATSASFSANTTSGTYAITATVTGVTPVGFTETNVAGSPVKVLISANPNSGAAASATANVTLTVQLLDTYGNATTGTSTTNLTLTTSSTSMGFFSSTSGGSGSFGANYAVAIPAGSGSASAYYGDEKAATPLITALNGAVNWGTVNVPIVAGPAATVAVSSGSSQSATLGSNFAAPLVALVSDAFNNPVSGTFVTFQAPSSGASATFVSSSTTTGTGTSGPTGLASSGTFTANGTLGTYLITGNVSGLTPVTFSETNLVGTPKTITVISGNSQAQAPSKQFTSPLVVVVKDANGYAVPNVNVTFLAPASGASGTFAGGTNTIAVQTGANGQATSPAYTANGAYGAYLITASVASASISTTFTESNLYHLVITPSPTSVAHGSSTNMQLMLQLTYEDGTNVSAIASMSVTLSTTGSGFFGTSSGLSNPNVSSTITVTLSTSGVGSVWFGDKKADSPVITTTTTGVILSPFSPSIT